MRDLDLVQEGLRRFDFCARNQLRAGDRRGAALKEPRQNREILASSIR